MHLDASPNGPTGEEDSSASDVSFCRSKSRLLESSLSSPVNLPAHARCIREQAKVLDGNRRYSEPCSARPLVCECKDGGCCAPTCSLCCNCFSCQLFKPGFGLSHRLEVRHPGWCFRGAWNFFNSLGCGCCSAHCRALQGLKRQCWIPFNLDGLINPHISRDIPLMRGIAAGCLSRTKAYLSNPNARFTDTTRMSLAYKFKNITPVPCTGVYRTIPAQARPTYVQLRRCSICQPSTFVKQH